MRIETERLKLLPLKVQDLKNYVLDYSFFADSLGINYEAKVISDFMKGIFEIKIGKIEGDPENWLLYTYWIILDRQFNEEAGMIGFKGLPDANGRVEIGYGTEEKFRFRGYMTESLRVLCDWSFTNLFLNIICASVKKDNPASIRVLEKNNFKLFDEDRDYYWYELKKSFENGGKNEKENI